MKSRKIRKQGLERKTSCQLETFNDMEDYTR